MVLLFNWRGGQFPFRIENVTWTDLPSLTPIFQVRDQFIYLSRWICIDWEANTGSLAVIANAVSSANVAFSPGSGNSGRSDVNIV